MYFFFHNQIYFSFSWGCLKKTKYNLICKVLTEVYLIARIPHSSSNSFLSKGKGQSCDCHGRQLDCLDRCCNDQLTGTSKIFILSADIL